MTEKEVILEIIYSSSIATKKDIKILYRKLSLNLGKKLEEKRLEIEKTIKIEIEKIRNEFQLEIKKLRAETEIKLRAMKNSLLKWIIGLILGQTLTIIIAIILK
jgi:hypothetical protein